MQIPITAALEPLLDFEPVLDFESLLDNAT